MNELNQMLVFITLLKQNLGDAKDLLREMSEEAREELLQAASDIQNLVDEIKTEKA